jgi:homopolymeric O-antigen transport system permease protein
MSVYADLLRYRELYGNLFRRDFEAKYRGSSLGVLWSVANPLLLMAIYLFVFSVVWKGFATVDHYALFLLVGLAPWTFFATSVQSSTRAMLDNANLIRKTRFPRQLVPLSVVGAHLVSFAVMLVLLLVLVFAVLPRARATEWLAVPLAALFVAFVGGLALALASLNVLFRDLEFIVAALLLPLFFLTPILYPLGGLPGLASGHHWIIVALHYLNPIAPAIEAIRDPLFYGELPAAVDVVYLVVATVASLALGAFVFRRVDDQIAIQV